MNDAQISPQANSESWPKGEDWNSGPWNGMRAHVAVFLVSLCVGAAGAWLGHNHGMSTERAQMQTDTAQANEDSGPGITVDTLIGGLGGFLGAETALGFGSVALQRHYVLSHTEPHETTPDAS